MRALWRQIRPIWRVLFPCSERQKNIEYAVLSSSSTSSAPHIWALVRFFCKRNISVWKVPVALVLLATVLNDFNEFQCQAAHCSQPKCKPFAIIQSNDNGLAFQVLDAYTLIKTANGAEAPQHQNLFTANQTSSTQTWQHIFFSLAGSRSFRFLIRAICDFKYEYPEWACAHCKQSQEGKNIRATKKTSEKRTTNKQTDRKRREAPWK